MSVHIDMASFAPRSPFVVKMVVFFSLSAPRPRYLISPI